MNMQFRVAHCLYVAPLVLRTPSINRRAALPLTPEAAPAKITDETSADPLSLEP